MDVCSRIILDDFYFLEGDWSDWGYFYYFDANPEQSIQWKIWLRNKAHESEKDYDIRLEVHSAGGELIATNRENMTFSLRAEWVRYEFDLIFPMVGTSGGAYFKAKDLLDNDGDYTLTVQLNGELYGEWQFRVSDGKFVPSGRTVRGEADSMTFIEGGTDAIWYGK